MQWLNGKKTYIGITAYGLLGFVQSLGWITPEQYATYIPLVQLWTGAAIAHKYDKKK